MSDRLSELEARLAELAEAHRQLERRLAALERRPSRAAPARPAAARTADVSGADVAADLGAVTGNLALAGRTLLVLAGAFLLRAITDAGTVPTWLGAALGFGYAGVWIAMAYRAGPAQPWNAAFHGLAALLIGFPLLVEATTRFRLLSPGAGAAMLTLLTGVALGVAARRRLHVLAALVVAGGILAAVALMIGTGRMVPATLFLIVAGVAALWLGYVYGWIYLRWPLAFVTDLAVVLITLRAVSPAAAEGPRAALVVHVVVTGLYLGSIAVRTLLLNRDVVDFEVVQTAVLVAAGVGGASYVSTQAQLAGGTVGLVSLAFGAAAYAVAFAFLERRTGTKTNFYFYGSVALVFVLAGSALVLTGPALALGWAVLAVAAAALARLRSRLTLAVHGCVYAVMAAVQGDAILHATTTVLASPTVAWPRASAAQVAVVAAMVAACWLTGRVTLAPPRLQQRIPRCALVATTAVAAAGLLVGWLVPLVAGAPGPGADAGVVATVRTGVLVAGVLVLAWSGTLEEWREAGWLAYPLLLVIAAKLVLEDIARSRPASLFLAFALYGAALILVPRLRRRVVAPRADPLPAPPSTPA
jgi:hypothetical protein